VSKVLITISALPFPVFNNQPFSFLVYGDMEFLTGLPLKQSDSS